MSDAFAYVVRGDEIVITHHGRKATVLRGGTAARFLEDVKAGDPQALVAGMTGNYKRGNERRAKHPRNRDRN